MGRAASYLYEQDHKVIKLHCRHWCFTSVTEDHFQWFTLQCCCFFVMISKRGLVLDHDLSHHWGCCIGTCLGAA